MDASKFKDELLAICDHYDRAEADLKMLGRESGKLQMAGINQCRYAGQHLARALRAIDAGKDDDAQANLQAADAHVRRAIYDINDASVNFYLGEIAAFRKRYPINLTPVVPSYGDVLESVSNAQQAIDEVTNTVHPEVGARAHTGIPWRFTEPENGVRMPAPQLGGTQTRCYATCGPTVC